MKAIILSVLASLGLMLSGCAGTPGFRPGPLRLAVTGVVSATSVPGEYVLADFEKTRISKIPIIKKTEAFRKIETEQIVRLELAQKYKEFHQYVILLGSDGVAGQTAASWVKNSEPTVYLDAGWTLLWGNLIELETEWASAAAEGTTIAVHIVNPDLHRFFLPADNSPLAKLTVTCKKNPSPKILKPGQYLDVRSDYTVDGPKSIGLDPDLKVFISELNEVAKVAGRN